ncbi:hypothetical protein BKP56_07085 [Marinilactibacillus sp. 15R]|uniref:hypothetical protein n=1 Tax=Marinilactibacillus sp. 15R TaxID=1911586 RepID=UPI00090C7640|nr:hypothetical protein [Marinilactibacillus sp. 15R]API89032.1 hypothetical protein BKP56_07085 [Marinilactibacillus sp. 15R]
MINEGLLGIWTLNRLGFQADIKIGEMVEHENEKYIIIHLFDIKLYTDYRSGAPYVKVRAILQNVNVKPQTSEYEINETIKIKYNVEKVNKREEEVLGVGDYYVTHLDNIEQFCYKISGVKSFGYESTDLVVHYYVEEIHPWQWHEVQKVVKQDRLSKFKVVS